MDSQNVIENINPQIQAAQPPKSNKTFVMGLVIAISLAVLFVFLIMVYVFVPGEKEVGMENKDINKIPVVTTVPGTAAEMTTSDEITDIDNDLSNTELPSIDEDLRGIEQQVGL